MLCARTVGQAVRAAALSTPLTAENCKGFALLAKTGGWVPGQGLGKSEQGRVAPIELQVRSARGGLGVPAPPPPPLPGPSRPSVDLDAAAATFRQEQRKTQSLLRLRRDLEKAQGIQRELDHASAPSRPTDNAEAPADETSTPPEPCPLPATVCNWEEDSEADDETDAVPAAAASAPVTEEEVPNASM